MLTQKQFAEKLGIARITAHYYEKGKRRPSVRVMDKLKKMYPKYFEDSSPNKERGGQMTDRIVANLLDQIDTLKSQIQTQAVSVNKSKGCSCQQDMITTIVDELNMNSGFDEVVQKLDGVQANWDFLFYNSNQAMSVAKDGVITNVNETFYKMLGYKQEEMIGSKIIDYIHPDEHDVAIRSIKSHKANQVHRVKKKNGRYIKLKIRAKNFGGKQPKDNTSYSVALIERVE